MLLQSIVAFNPALADGDDLSTVTTTVSAVLSHPAALVTTKLYVIVLLGVAVGRATVVEESPVDGVHA